MSLHSYEFKDPAGAIGEIAERVTLSEDTVYVALVARPSTEQRIVTVRRLRTPALIDDYQDARDEIYELMQRLPIPEDPGPPQHAALTVIVRPGLCVFGPNEGEWLNAWWYSNHLTNAFSGDLVLVTEHGWTSFMSDEAGGTPSLAA